MANAARKRMSKKLLACCACCAGSSAISPDSHSDEDSDEADVKAARRATPARAPLPRPPTCTSTSSTSTSATPSSTRHATAMDDLERTCATAERGSSKSFENAIESASAGAARLEPRSRRPPAPGPGGRSPLFGSSGHSERESAELLSNASASPSASHSHQSIAQLFLQSQSAAAFATPTRPHRLPPRFPQLSLSRVHAAANSWTRDGDASACARVPASTAASHCQPLLIPASPVAGVSAFARRSLASSPSRSNSLSQANQTSASVVCLIQSVVFFTVHCLYLFFYLMRFSS